MTHVACSTFKNSQFFEKMKDPQISIQKVDHVRNMGVVPFFSTSNESCRMVKNSQFFDKKKDPRISVSKVLSRPKCGVC